MSAALSRARIILRFKAIAPPFSRARPPSPHIDPPCLPCVQRDCKLKPLLPALLWTDNRLAVLGRCRPCVPARNPQRKQERDVTAIASRHPRWDASRIIIPKSRSAAFVAAIVSAILSVDTHDETNSF